MSLYDYLTPAFVEELLELGRRFDAIVWLVRMGSAWQPLLMPRPRLDA